jgi:hypothetical protein
MAAATAKPAARPAAQPRPTAQPPARSGGRPPRRAPGPVPDRYRTRKVTVRPPWWRGPWALGGIAAAVVAIVLIFVLVATTSSPPKPAGSTAEGPIAPASVVSEVTGVTLAEATTIGSGGVSNPLLPVPGSPAKLTGPDGKPELFFFGAEFCPICAAERWSMVVALSRFGTFTDLRTTTSSSTDTDPNTHTFSFYGASYTSEYLDFAPIEAETRTQGPLQTPSSAEQTLLTQYDTDSQGEESFPYLDLGNLFEVSGSAVNAGLLQGLSWQQIADDLGDPTNDVAQAIIGNANYLTAGICEMTGNQPTAVCTNSTIAALETQLGAS